jgi:hypothetical protein
MDAETRAYLDGMRSDLRELRAEVGQLGTELRAEMELLAAELRAEMGQLGGELRGEIHQLREAAETTAVETRRHFDVTAEDLRGLIRTVAEGVAVNREAIDRLGVEIHQEMDERFKAVALSFADVRNNFMRIDRKFVAVRRDIAQLRTRR